jgi:SAM-dependent methyltransferase
MAIPQNTAQAARLQDRLEILSVELLDQQRPLVMRLRRLARSLHLDFGWHYLLDLSWILSQLGNVRGKRVLDAGAGTGLIQWYLAEQGAEVISVDRMSRAHLPLRFRQRYRVQGMRKQDLAPIRQVFQNSWKGAGTLQVKIKNQLKDLSGMVNLHRSTGKVIIYNQDLRSLADIPDNSIDMVVSVSALEHNPPENLPMVRAELLRVLRPGGALLATLCAAEQQDWLHEPSQGWCYTDASLRRQFALAEDAPSNYERYAELFQALRECAELRSNLARFYYRSGEGGMPWGIWDPKYQPVGVCKMKAM